MEKKVKDLVCGMEFAKEEAKGTFKYKGKTYHFCNLGCKEKFTADPEKYIVQE
jgi:Cu+-exporting ATPase